MPILSRPSILNAKLKRVHAFYAKGKASRDDSSDRIRYGEANKSAERNNLHPEMLRKARQIAREFPEDKFEELLSTCEASGFAIGITHLMRLASVDKGRVALITRMINGRWSLRQLNNEIAKLRPSVPGRGRRRLIPANESGRIVVLKRECIRWQRLNQQLTVQELKSRRVRKALQDAAASIDSLAAALNRH